MPRTRKRGPKIATKTLPPETAENCLLKDYDDNVMQTLAAAEDFVVHNPPSLMGMLYGDLPPSVVWKVLYLVNRQITSEEECTLLCLLTDYLAGEFVDLGLLNPGNKYNTPTYILLEEVANAWNHVLQQPRVFKDKKLLKSLLFNLKKSLSSFSVYGFDHYFSRTLDIVSKHELGQSVVPFFTYPMVPKNFSIPEYKVKRILSAGKVPRQNLYHSQQDTACKSVSQIHKKPRWDYSDTEWVPSDDELEMSCSSFEFDGKDSDPTSDVDLPLSSVSQEFITQIQEPLEDISNFSSSVRSSKNGQRTQKGCLEELRDKGEKIAAEQKENYISWKGLVYDHYDEFDHSSPAKDREAPQKSQKMSDSRQSSNSRRDAYAYDSDYSLSPVIKKRYKDSPQRSRKDDVSENETKVKTAQKDVRIKNKKTAKRDLYGNDYYSLSPILKKRDNDRKENVDIKEKKMKTILKDPEADKLNFGSDSELKRKERQQRWTELSARKEETSSIRTTQKDLYDDEYLYSQSRKPSERKSEVRLKLKKLSGSRRHENMDVERQQSREHVVKAFSDDSNFSLPDLDDQNAFCSIRQCREDSPNDDQVLLQQTDEDDYYARRVGFRSFNDTASDVESLCLSEFSGGEASLHQFIPRSEDKQRENLEFQYDDLSCASQITKQKKRKDSKDHVCGSPAKRSKYSSSTRPCVEDKLKKISVYDESFQHANPYRTPEITKPNNRDTGREIFPSSPSKPEKTPSKSKNQDIRRFFKGCC